MRLLDGQLVLSPTDLTEFTRCAHATSPGQIPRNRILWLGLTLALERRLQKTTRYFEEQVLRKRPYPGGPGGRVTAAASTTLSRGTRRATARSESRGGRGGCGSRRTARRRRGSHSKPRRA